MSRKSRVQPREKILPSRAHTHTHAHTPTNRTLGGWGSHIQNRQNRQTHFRLRKPFNQKTCPDLPLDTVESIGRLPRCLRSQSVCDYSLLRPPQMLAARRPRVKSFTNKLLLCSQCPDASRRSLGVLQRDQEAQLPRDRRASDRPEEL
jgi:hypothetical protein